MDKRRKILKIFAFVLAIFALFSFCRFVKSEKLTEEKIFCPVADVLSPIGNFEEIKNEFPVPLGPARGNFISRVKRGGAAACFDIEAFNAKAEFPEMQFSPMGLSTVVFAVDRDKTDIVPTSWEDLFSSGLVINFTGKKVQRRLVMGAFEYAFSGEEYDRDYTVKRLRDLKEKGLFNYECDEGDVFVCLDSDAVQMIDKGRNFEIIVPSDGTYTFEFGILAEDKTFVPDEKALLENGFMLLDGRTASPHYPSPDSYKNAMRVKDPELFLKSTEDVVRDIRRSVLGSRILNSTESRETVVMTSFSILVILLWTMYLLYKSPSKELTQWFLILSCQMICWLFISMYKYIQQTYSVLTRLCWYSYYIFLMGLPLSLLYISLIMDKPSGKKKIPGWFKLFAVSYALLLLTIFTNDFHNLVFKFDLNGNWNTEYTYGPAYYLIFGLCILSFLLATVILTIKTKKSPRRLLVAFPVCVSVLIIIYNVAYIIGIPIARESNLPVVFCAFSMLFVEAALRAGLIPSNTYYRELFTSSPLEMQLIDEKGERRYFAPDSTPLTENELDFVLKNPEKTLPCGDDMLLHSFKINGGTAVWKEDISSVNKLHKELHDSIENMERANSILKKEEELRRRELNNDLKEKLFLEMESNIEDKTKELSEMIRNLPEGEKRKEEVAYIPLLLCHIKRLCNIFFVSQERKTMSGTELAVYLDELSEFASYAEIKALVRCNIHGNMDVEAVKLCYNFYFGVLSHSFKNKDNTVIGMLKKKDNRFIFDITQSENMGVSELSETFIEDASKYGASLSNFSSDDTEGLRLTFCEKTEGDDQI